MIVAMSLSSVVDRLLEREAVNHRHPSSGRWCKDGLAMSSSTFPSVKLEGLVVIHVWYLVWALQLRLLQVGNSGDFLEELSTHDCDVQSSVNDSFCGQSTMATCGLLSLSSTHTVCTLCTSSSSDSRYRVGSAASSGVSLYWIILAPARFLLSSFGLIVFHS